MVSIEDAVHAWATAKVVLDAVVVIESGQSVAESRGVLVGDSYRSSVDAP